MRINYRVAGVAIHNGRIILTRNSRNTYWVLPGGHPEMMEPMVSTLHREIYEEIGADVKVGRLLWIIENFFYRKREIHELSFYFLIELNPHSPLMKNEGPFYGLEHDHPLIYQWFAIDEIILKNLPIFPGYLANALLHIPETPLHIVYNSLSPA
jgi:8-oxo-dGTP pyrophosphatase MutT (NUDIX family)